MSLLQTAYRTFENHAQLAGVIEEGKREALLPVGHQVQNAHIEITISDDGLFRSARAISKDESKTIIPVTVASGSRSGTKTSSRPHPLCDQLPYLAPYSGESYEIYSKNLTQWAQSAYSHPTVRAVLQYIRQGTIVTDLTTAGVIQTDSAGRPDKSYSKSLVRWRIIPAPEGGKAACWEDPSLFNSYTAYYNAQCTREPQDICMVTGQLDTVCTMHPKGVVASDFGAKLVSANDGSGFTYRGRFSTDTQAANVGYHASQKAHSALRYLTANQGVRIGNRTFLCWNPEGQQVQQIDFLGLPGEDPLDFEGYQRELRWTLYGGEQKLKPLDDVVIAAMEAATTGRLSVTYYRELKASDYLKRVEQWYESCCWVAGKFGVQSPRLRQIVNCAFGVQRKEYMETDDRILSQHFQRLVHCIVDAQSIPTDIVQALTNKASNLLAYSSKPRISLVHTACAVIRKYRNDKLKKEVWKLALDTSNCDRSYLFGRLLAVAEQAERSTYNGEEGREPNAIRMQAVFSRRPLYVWRIIEESLNPYFSRMKPGLRIYYKRLIDEIMDKLPGTDSTELNQRLEDCYLLGYSHQRTALFQKKETTIKGEKENEFAES